VDVNTPPAKAGMINRLFSNWLYPGDKEAVWYKECVHT